MGAPLDRDQLDMMLLRNLPDLRAFLRLRMDPELRQHESCSDLVQSVCRQVLQGEGRLEFQGEKAFRSYLCTAALNKIRDRRRHWLADRRAGTLAQPTAGGDADDQLLRAYATFLTPSGVAQARELQDRVERAFDQMPEDYREVLTLSRLLGWSHREIAAHLGRSEGATRTLFSRALARLATLLEEGPGD